MQRHLLLRSLENWSWLPRSTANLQVAPTRYEFLDEWRGGSAIVETATAGLTGRGQDVEALHHAQIFMIQGMAMPDKTADRHWIEIGAKSNRSRWEIIDVDGITTARVSGGTHDTRDIQGVVPFGLRQGDAVYFCDQHMILMEVERMV